tara:strand:- start:1050 stop:1562 length:513 start_codon:yes stop_codon:yes gene_type:complete
MIILGLGSNLSSSFGDRFFNIDLAISYLESYNIKVGKKSSYYETPSYPDKINPKFINVIIDVITDLPAVDLASVIIHIEKKLERKRNRKNDPRTCDIDIIDYLNKTTSFKYENFTFKVPHENLHLRNFVLLPLKEIHPNWKHPETGEFIDTLIKNLSVEERKSILKIENS